MDLPLEAGFPAPVYPKTEIWLASWVLIDHVLYYCIGLIIGSQGFDVFPASVPPGSVGFPPINRVPSFFFGADVAQDHVGDVPLPT